MTIQVGDRVYCNRVGERFWDNRNNGRQLYYEGDIGEVVDTNVNSRGQGVIQVVWENCSHPNGNRWWICVDGVDIIPTKVYSPVSETDRLALESLVEVLST